MERRQKDQGYKSDSVQTIFAHGVALTHTHTHTHTALKERERPREVKESQSESRRAAGAHVKA